MKLIAIAAMTSNRIIAIDGKMPWKCTEDMKHFRETTMGSPVIMGRKTFDSMNRKPLSGRHNIVLSRSVYPEATEYKSVESVSQAISQAQKYCNLIGCDTAYVIGGEEIYKQFAPYVDEANLSIIEEKHLDSELIQMADYSGKGLVVNYFPLEYYKHILKVYGAKVFNRF